jgi:hypothetical protein
VKSALATLGIAPSHVSVPTCLYPFAGRKVWRTSVGLVEVNDGYARGCGGLLPSLYAELLRARWEELTEK